MVVNNSEACGMIINDFDKRCSFDSCISHTRCIFSFQLLRFQEAYLTSALDCYLDAKDPDNTPDYSGCPNEDSTPLPTQPPQATCQDSPLPAFVQNRERDCNWVASNGNRCTRRRFWSHCHESCNVCDRCQDSLLFFNYNIQQMKCATDVTTDMCDDTDIALTRPRKCHVCCVGRINIVELWLV
jgi:hypothetical protein